jgi:hypothetical protein
MLRRRGVCALLVTAASFGVLAALGDCRAADEKKEGANRVTEGQPAPDIELPAANVDKPLRLKDYQGKKHVVLFFFPKAATRG